MFFKVISNPNLYLILLFETNKQIQQKPHTHTKTSNNQTKTKPKNNRKSAARKTGLFQLIFLVPYQTAMGLPL